MVHCGKPYDIISSSRCVCNEQDLSVAAGRHQNHSTATLVLMQIQRMGDSSRFVLVLDALTQIQTAMIFLYRGITQAKKVGRGTRIVRWK